MWRMFHTWREKSYTDVVLALLPNVDEEMFIDLANAIRDDSVGVGWSNLELLHRRLDETIWQVVETIAYTLAR